MKKFLLTLICAVGICYCAKAEYLYWQVGDSLNGVPFESGKQYTAVLYAGNAEVTAYEGKLGMDSVQAYDVTGYSSSTTFHIEVFAYDSPYTQVADSSSSPSSAWTYQQLAHANAIRSSWTEETLRNSMAVWTGTRVVPEPTSGMMVLVGMALLGLKRRRV